MTVPESGQQSFKHRRVLIEVSGQEDPTLKKASREAERDCTYRDSSEAQVLRRDGEDLVCQPGSLHQLHSRRVQAAIMLQVQADFAEVFKTFGWITLDPKLTVWVESGGWHPALGG